MTSKAPRRTLVHVLILGGARNPRRVPNILRLSVVGVQNKLGYLARGCQKPGKPNSCDTGILGVYGHLPGKTLA